MRHHTTFLWICVILMIQWVVNYNLITQACPLFNTRNIWNRVIDRLVYEASNLQTAATAAAAAAASSTTTANTASHTYTNVNDVYNHRFDRFFREWGYFYQSHLEHEAMQQSSHHSTGYGYSFAHSILFFFKVILFIKIASKIASRFVMTQYTTFNMFGFPRQRYALRRSFYFRLRQWKLFLLNKFVSLSKSSKVVLAEKHEDNEKIVYAYSIPLEMVQRIKVTWNETGNDPSSMDTKLIISANALPVSVFAPYFHFIVRLFGEEFTEIDIFGPSISLVEVPMAKSTVDPNDINVFWETSNTPFPETQDDKLLYIRIPKIGHRVMELSINNGDPAGKRD